jgi:ABC-type Mn2+/Zn2+ transport system permease subunit
VKNLVEGNILTVGAPELGRLAWSLVPVLLLLALSGRRLLLSTFDRETAATLGVRTGLLEVLFFVCLAVVVASGVHSTGTLFVFGFLVLPGATGLVVGRSAVTVFLTAVVSSVLAAGGGFVLSYAWDAPTGPMCVATLLAIFLVASAAAWATRFVSARLEARLAVG